MVHAFSDVLEINVRLSVNIISPKWKIAKMLSLSPHPPFGSRCSQNNPKPKPKTKKSRREIHTKANTGKPNHSMESLLRWQSLQLVQIEIHTYYSTHTCTQFVYKKYVSVENAKDLHCVFEYDRVKMIWCLLMIIMDVFQPPPPLSLPPHIFTEMWNVNGEIMTCSCEWKPINWRHL